MVRNKAAFCMGPLFSNVYKNDVIITSSTAMRI